ncbi:lipoprotein [Streptomyces lienomycini]
MRTGKGATAVATASVCVALLAGCGGDSGDEGEAFEGQSADDIAAKAVEATRQAKSMHVKGDTRLEDGSTVTIDVSVDQEKNCEGTIGAGGTEADVRHTDATLYLRGDERYWRTALKQQPDAARKMVPELRDKWVKMPANDATTAGVCDKQGFVAAMDEDESERRGMKRGSTTDVNGAKALELTKDASGGEKLTLYVATEGEPYLLKTTTEGGKNPGSVTFGEYGETVDPEQPPAAETVDMKDLAGGQRA